MSTNLNLLSKALIRLGIVILLFIVSPIGITMGFKAINTFTESPGIYFAYLFLIVGFLLLFYAIYFAFKTFGILSKAIFNDK
ncbi:DUF6095 family protein [Polaribacter sp.]|jgi:hypothetical protein|uniref:DUF6095 family protein n=1 Tax=Polaribacter sp. TaxID=1920175 RepID=UPI003F6987CA